MTNRERYDQWFTNYRASLNAAELYRVISTLGPREPNSYFAPYYQKPKGMFL